MPGSHLREKTKSGSYRLSRKPPAGTENDQELPQRKRAKHIVEKLQPTKQSQAVPVRKAVSPSAKHNLECEGVNDDIQHVGDASRCIASEKTEDQTPQEEGNFEDELPFSDVSSDVGFQTPPSTGLPWQNLSRKGKLGSSLMYSGSLRPSRAEGKNFLHSIDCSPLIQGGVGKIHSELVEKPPGLQDLQDQQSFSDVPTGPGDELRDIFEENHDLVHERAGPGSIPSSNEERLSETGKKDRFPNDNDKSSHTIAASPEMTPDGGFQKEAMLTNESMVSHSDKTAQGPKDAFADTIESPELISTIVAESDEDFADSDLERMLVGLPSGIPEISRTTTQKAQSGLQNAPKLQWLPPKTYIPGRTTSELSPCRPEEIRPSESLSTTQGLEAPKPFIRGAFPRILADGSPIHGLQSKTVLQTCFRIGEAIKASASVQRSKRDAIIELYARVLSSHRDPGPNSCKQYVELRDLFTEKPPYLHGTYTLWKDAPVWDQESQVFLGEEGGGKICRVIGRIKKAEPTTISPTRDMVILSISEMTWSKINWMRGIVGT